eukprot:CAMPEP_0205908314 /NCGR_PEP_ID=MMETSP1325-20131115/3131_1 /ASSEMBLY_ACC=CAM_ASM_000708 /TAXON_ID=236786 /ORGANISM="Florenciella sp., Strain RCC1007" /LENGTH=183 /DNA_ID=CAMNT_0053274499 /DNA_START=117 /DNA_END=668 /DNA_ORIENTATION=-
MAQHPDIDFEVRWRPFLLNPAASTKGVNKLQMYKEKFGEDRVEKMVPMMKAKFAAVGIDYSMGGKTGSTFDSHRLATYAYQQGGAQMQNQLMEELFMNYFSEEKFLGDPSVLKAAAAKVGLDGADAVVDDKNALKEEVETELQTHARGIHGVPHFFVNEYQISGAQPTEVFQQLFEQIAEEDE